ncbi:Mitochondrial import protein Pam17 [Moelleriella libera RCEF 2490]|uniref:Presequence translocated-associated motor subunit PAM17 n=1 Tax=Moelleriella libera RCEF 2490 TaxID=1081109 RepID=A0A162I9R6_9HYPO|nr:Mitochondrial import protein Pam17 [Moelleriella libera RCEF 2490]
MASSRSSSSSLNKLVLRLPRARPTPTTSSSSPRGGLTIQCGSRAPVSTVSAANAHAVVQRRQATLTLSAARPLRGSHDEKTAHAILRLATPPRSIVSQARCFASAPASTSSQAASSSSSSSSSATAPQSALDWDTFFKLRLRRRRIQLLFSVTTGLFGGAGGAVLLSTGLAEPLVMQIPLDPFVTLGLMTLACAGMGWLAGPSIGNQVFYLMNHRFKAQMMQKESEFFTRVKKHRVDPSNSSAGNPVPDFYGEKIQSVMGYRQWLKDQRAFDKKKTRAFV